MAKVNQHPGGEGDFKIVKGTRSISEQRNNPNYDVAKAPKGKAGAMKDAKARHRNLVARAHSHAGVSPGPVADVVKPSGSGIEIGNNTIGARVRRSIQATGIAPKGANLLRSEPYGGENY